MTSPAASPAAMLGIGAVRLYQYTLRGFIGPNCRFCPSCSDYAVEALRTHGALRGGAMAGWRILRCNPWNAGGYDPVKARETATAVLSGRD
jgi:putative membrane protein insertion efficiency factor